MTLTLRFEWLSTSLRGREGVSVSLEFQVGFCSPPAWSDMWMYIAGGVAVVIVLVLVAAYFGGKLDAVHAVGDPEAIQLRKHLSWGQWEKVGPVLEATRRNPDLRGFYVSTLCPEPSMSAFDDWCKEQPESPEAFLFKMEGDYEGAQAYLRRADVREEAQRAYDASLGSSSHLLCKATLFARHEAAYWFWIIEDKARLVREIDLIADRVDPDHWGFGGPGEFKKAKAWAKA